MAGTYSLLIQMVEQIFKIDCKHQLYARNLKILFWCSQFLKLTIVFGLRSYSKLLSTVYKFLVERKVLLWKDGDFENIIKRRDASVLGSQSNGNCHEKESACYTRTLDQGYVFFKDGHVQKVWYHSMPSLPGYICSVTINEET